MATLSECLGSVRHWVVASALLVVLSPVYGAAQDTSTPSSLMREVVAEVAYDPTTYAPSGIAYVATRLDWASSQPLFQRGFLESNPRYTVSGLPNDVPIDYGTGSRRILIDGLENLGISLVNNAANRVLEHALIARYPTHTKLVRTITWIERISFGAFMSYHLSGDHFRQWQANKRLVRQLGIR